MKELFLIAALTLPGNFYRANPHWNWGEPECKVVRLLRDWPNGYTGSRPLSWVLIYGCHPLWAHLLRGDGINVIGMYHQHVRWPGYVQGYAIKTPFRDKQFQVYIYDYFPIMPVDLVKEASRIIADHGFFLYRFTKNGEMVKALQEFGWERFSLDFHEFTIWWRPKNYDHIELTMSVTLRSA